MYDCDTLHPFSNFASDKSNIPEAPMLYNMAVSAIRDSHQDLLTYDVEGSLGEQTLPQLWSSGKNAASALVLSI